MNAQVPGRGHELVAAGRPLGIGPQWLARLWAGGLNRVLDRIDAGLARGSIMATLPDGSTRLLGGREEGFDCVVELRSFRALLRLATGGSVGWYQAWEAGEWTSPDPVPLFALFMDNAITLGQAARARGPWRLAARWLHRLHRNSRKGAQRNIHAHYDLGNDFYAQWLGTTMFYSSALFSRENGPSQHAQFFSELDAGQSAKVAALDQRLTLSPGERVLEIGCGWGTLAACLAEERGVLVDAISLSDEQLDYAGTRWSPKRGAVDFRKQDYRDVAGAYDAIVSVEMVEAVGREYWGEFLDCIARNLRPGGRAALQYISLCDELFESYAQSADFIQTYIFPGGMLLNEPEFRALAEERGLTWEDHQPFGLDYARTLAMWRERFDDAVEEGRLPVGFDEHFVRLWRYYLMYCEGGFLGGGIDVAQVTLRKAA
ncbi:cyclopropane-fatty-acyl-phospholipid synthase family protein [Novosphingobium sp. 9U]|uniref:SAM-dependent methyltransferase n=1 Tax=Novosphingobium sp. 9U TaxID=2653158 RepID=UPI0012F47509|nr:cyclopropane-fatty-acyl-phospholipid synthase family protein [Novosphingobium sp. 9U]VWX55097.1 Cyclopropane-fatty-acyl-phospholipid synthase [Novosphingobium sp. 9U]